MEGFWVLDEELFWRISPAIARKNPEEQVPKKFILETVRVFLCRREGPYTMGIRASEEINKERIAALWVRNLIKSGSRISLLKWLFAAQGN